MKTLVLYAPTREPYRLYSCPIVCKDGEHEAEADRMLKAYFEGDSVENSRPYHDIQIGKDWTNAYGFDPIGKFVTARQTSYTQPDRYKAIIE